MRRDFEEPYDAFRLALIMNKDNKEAAYELMRVEKCWIAPREELLRYLGALPSSASDASKKGRSHHPHPHAEAKPMSIWTLNRTWTTMVIVGAAPRVAVQPCSPRPLGSIILAWC